MRSTQPKLAVRKLYDEWKLVPKKKRVPRTKKAFALANGVVEQTLANWDKRGNDLDRQLNDLPIEEQIKVFRSLMFKIIQNPSASTMDRKLFAEMYGLRTDKSEVKVEIGLSADEITRRNLEAERRLREEGYRALPRPGVEEVQGISPLLSNEIRLDSEQEHRSDN